MYMLVLKSSYWWVIDDFEDIEELADYEFDFEFEQRPLSQNQMDIREYFGFGTIIKVKSYNDSIDHDFYTNVYLKSPDYPDPDREPDTKYEFIEIISKESAFIGTLDEVNAKYDELTCHTR